MTREELGDQLAQLEAEIAAANCSKCRKNSLRPLINKINREIAKRDAEG